MNIAINMAVFLATALIYPSGFILENMTVAAVAALVLALLNLVLKPLLLLVSLPFLLLTMGLFAWVVNALLLELTAHLVPGFAFSSFWAAMVVALFISVANNLFIARED